MLNAAIKTNTWLIYFLYQVFNLVCFLNRALSLSSNSSNARVSSDSIFLPLPHNVTIYVTPLPEQLYTSVPHFGDTLA